MITHLFVHASYAVRNSQDLSSLIGEKIAGASLLERLLIRLQRCTELQRIHVVTSDQMCDDRIEAIVSDVQGSATAIPVDCIHIPSSTPYRIDESNRHIADDFLFKRNYYGFHAAECLLRYASEHPHDLALILNADDVPLIEPDTIDYLILTYHKKGVMYGFSGKNICVWAIPLAELSAKISGCIYKYNQLLQEETLRIKDAISTVSQVNPGIDTGALETTKITHMKRSLECPVRSEEILGQIYTGESYGRYAARNEYYEFYPVHTPRQFDTIRQFFEKYIQFSAETFSEYYNEMGASSNTYFPSMIELEITNRCNLKCTHCPQTVLTRSHEDMRRDVFERSIAPFAWQSPMLILSGYGEPTLHPQLIDFIQHAKRNYMRVTLETNGTMLTEEYIEQLIDAHLDVLLINLDAYDKYASKSGVYPSEQLLQTILKIRSQKNTEFPYIVVQTVNKKSRQQAADYYYKRWEYVVDAVVIQQYNDYCTTFPREELINLAPVSDKKICQKTFTAMVVLASGIPTLCKQKFDGFLTGRNSDLCGIWLDNVHQGGFLPFCEGCLQRYFPEFLIYPQYDHSLRYKMLDTFYHEILEQKIKAGDDCFDKKDYQNALLNWEFVLRYYPDHALVWERIEKLSPPVK